MAVLEIDDSAAARRKSSAMVGAHRNAPIVTMASAGRAAMPEFPEVETVRRGLAPAMEGARFAKVEVRRGRSALAAAADLPSASWPDRHRPWPAGKISAGRSVVRRRAGDASRHVRLVSRFRKADARSSARYHHERRRHVAHDHVVFHMSSGSIVTFNDPRRSAR